MDDPERALIAEIGALAQFGAVPVPAWREARGGIYRLRSRS
jgi:hypothetical protein